MPGLAIWVYVVPEADITADEPTGANQDPQYEAYWYEHGQVWAYHWSEATFGRPEGGHVHVDMVATYEPVPAEVAAAAIRALGADPIEPADAPPGANPTRSRRRFGHG